MLAPQADRVAYPGVHNGVKGAAVARIPAATSSCGDHDIPASDVRERATLPSSRRVDLAAASRAATPTRSSFTTNATSISMSVRTASDHVNRAASVYVELAGRSAFVRQFVSRSFFTRGLSDELPKLEPRDRAVPDLPDHRFGCVDPHGAAATPFLQPRPFNEEFSLPASSKVFRDRANAPLITVSLKDALVLHSSILDALITEWYQSQSHLRDKLWEYKGSLKQWWNSSAGSAVKADFDSLDDWIAGETAPNYIYEVPVWKDKLVGSKKRDAKRSAVLGVQLDGELRRLRFYDLFLRKRYNEQMAHADAEHAVDHLRHAEECYEVLRQCYDFLLVIAQWMRFLVHQCWATLNEWKTFFNQPQTEWPRVAAAFKADHDTHQKTERLLVQYQFFARNHLLEVDHADETLRQALRINPTEQAWAGWKWTMDDLDAYRRRS
jgi:hypothetical protein